MANNLKLYKVHPFSTSPNSCQRTTVLNADVPNLLVFWDTVYCIFWPEMHQFLPAAIETWKIFPWEKPPDLCLPGYTIANCTASQQTI